MDVLGMSDDELSMMENNGVRQKIVPVEETKNT
jgi:hypothetical protein